MEKKKYVYWQDDDMWLGYLEEYPDYMTQGETIEGYLWPRWYLLVKEAE